VPTIVGDDHPRTRRTRHIRNVRVVDTTTGDRITRCAAKHREPVGCRQVVNGHPREDLFFEQSNGIRRRNPELGWESRRD